MLIIKRETELYNFFEIYTSNATYKNYIQTAHFKKCENDTLKAVQLLEVMDVLTHHIWKQERITERNVNTTSVICLS